MSSRVDRDEDVRRSYARDASGLELVPEGVSRPADEREIVELLRQASAEGTAVTPAGAQTSTTGASITERGVLLSLAALDQVLDLDVAARTVRVQPGVRLGALKRLLAPQGLMFAPDPTSEEDCTVGGAIACNASGARTLRYGATRAHVQGLRVVLASGEVVELARTALEKNTVGYALAHDPVDWFVGSEGTLGVVVEATLHLLPLPERVTGLGIPFRSEAAALAFVVAARESARVKARCLEYFDAPALEIARTAHGGNWAAGAAAFVYAEEAGHADDEPPLEDWIALAESHDATVDDVLVFEGESALRDARRMRHAVPATMNERGASRRAAGGRKLSTDWAVPYRRLAEMIAAARALADEAGIAQAVTYGHAGSGHPHQNFIADDAAERERIEAVIGRTLERVLAMGGTVAAEHGIGKVKRRWLPLQATPLQLGVMRAVKRELDPHGILSPGNVLDG
ncbi:MAG TPA: FAD-binding oxidoreductase [Gemmatimonadaceae bacterium]|nr:FAD-binding oxidoreductase [Gemmatimonadaceae bacterium]